MYLKIMSIIFATTVHLQAVAQESNFESCVSPSDISFEPTVKWQWSGSSIASSYNQVMSMPIVVPLEDTNGDGHANQFDTPSVVFVTFKGGNYHTDGIVRAVSGKDGRDLWAATDYRVTPGGTIAAADIDNDGIIEIIALSSETADYASGIVVFDHTGKLKWQKLFTSPINSYTGIAIADLEGDGTPEIIIRGLIFDNTGTLKWEATWEVKNNYSSVVADINLDKQQEVILGGSAYSAQGKLLWRNPNVGRGFVAIGNFDSDKYPEIVVSGKDKVSLLSHTGELIWQVPMPGGSNSSVPTLADMDGDNQLEIGVAGANYYVVFKADGSVLWKSPIVDTSSVTGSSVFDFNGDGKYEVLYNDQYYFRVYNGSDGQIIFQKENTSSTLMELPVIADADGDGHADIILASNSYGFKGQTGITVFENKNNDWLNTRKIWNQHTYHVTDINDDGSVPQLEQPSWLANNTYRSIPALSPSGKICVRPATTYQLYAVQDAGLNDSQFFTAKIENNTSEPSYTVQKLGSVYAGYDIEAIAIHPKTNVIYAASGNNTSQDIPHGHLYTLDAETGKLYPIGATGFNEIGDLTFSSSGQLYAYAKGHGIITIDTETGKGEVWLASEAMIEGLTLVKQSNDKVFYGSDNQKLWAFNVETGALTTKCSNLPGETEALEAYSDELVLLTVHDDSTPKIHFFDTVKCELLPTLAIPTPQFNDVEGLALPASMR